APPRGGRARSSRCSCWSVAPRNRGNGCFCSHRLPLFSDCSMTSVSHTQVLSQKSSRRYRSGRTSPKRLRECEFPFLHPRRSVQALPSDSRTIRTPSTIDRALATATCRAVCEKPQSGVTDTRDGPGDDVEEQVVLAGVAGEAWLVELEEVDPGGNARLELGVDDRDQGLGHGPAIGVDLASRDAPREGERAGNRHLDRRAGQRAELDVLVDDTQSAGRTEGPRAEIPAPLIVGRRSPVAQ